MSLVETTAQEEESATKESAIVMKDSQAKTAVRECVLETALVMDNAIREYAYVISDLQESFVKKPKYF